MKSELSVVTKSWALIPTPESRALIDRSLALLDRRDIGNNRMSPYQLENFVLDEEHPTPWGKYKQAIAEIESRIGILMSDHVQYRQAQAKKAQADWKANKLRWLSWIGYYRAERDLTIAESDQQALTFATVQRHIEHCLLELKTFEAKAQQYFDECDGRSVIELEKEYWLARKEYFERKSFEAVTKNVTQMMYAQRMVRQELEVKHG